MITTVRQLPSLTDYSALQDDLTALLLAHAPLYQVNASQERNLLLESNVAIDSLWSNPRNAGAGAGIIVEDVRPNTSEQNTPGPIADLVCGFVVLAERNVCMTPGIGCGLHPEQIEQIIVDLLHLKLLQPYGQLRCTGQFGEPAADWISEDTGIYARRVKLKLLNARKQTDTCDLVAISNVAGTVAITCTCTAPGLKIWFTTDGSFPGELTASAKVYTEPFTVDPGTVVRAMAYADNINPSALKQIVV
ncbi:MAG: chitobiase/beta-hexosaminidase C-terminal domain-containing protein [Verrucomicrobiota bacterium]